jgi:hypothetical protein
MITNFKEFSEELLLEGLLNESVVYFSSEFRRILQRMKNNDIAKALLELEFTDIEKPDLSFIDISDQDGFVTFNTMRNAIEILNSEDWDKDFISNIKIEPNVSEISQRINDIDDIYTNSHDVFKKKAKNPLRLGILINKLFPGRFSDDMREKFINLFKSLKEKSGERFEIVEGDDIAYWYYHKNYAEDGGRYGTDLYNSCMKKSDKNIFQIYIDNPEVCKMLILLNEMDELIGRAIIWKLSYFDSELSDGSEVYFMDRQYTIENSDVLKFREYAKSNNWAYKTFNNYRQLKNVTYKGEEISANMSVEVKKTYNKYPYMDTFRRFDPETYTLFNDIDEIAGHYLLDHTDGSHTEIEEGFWSDYEDRRINSEYAVWSDYENSYLHIDNSVNIRYNNRRGNDWIPSDSDYIVYDEWNDVYIAAHDSKWSDYNDYYINEKDAVLVITDLYLDENYPDMEPDIGSDWFHKDDSAIIYIDYYMEKLPWRRVVSSQYDYILKSLLTKGYENYIPEIFAIETYKILGNGNNLINDNDVPEYLIEIDAIVLGYKVDKNDVRIIDIFQYNENILENILVDLHSILKRERKRIESELETTENRQGIGSQKRFIFSDSDEHDFLTKLSNRKGLIVNRIKEIEKLMNLAK